MQRVSHKIHRLVLGDGEILPGCLRRVPLSQFRTATTTGPGKFATTRQQSGAISLDLAIFPHQAKLHREPVTSCQAFNVRIVSAEAGKANLLGQVGKCRVGKHGRMAYQLMADIRLRRIVRDGTVPDILGREEHPEGQTIQEGTRTEQPRHGSQPKPRSGLQKAADVSALGNFGLAETTMFLQGGQGIQVFPAGIPLMQLLQFAVHLRPGVGFFLRIVNRRKLRIKSIIHGQLFNRGAAASIGPVVESRMVRGQLHPRIQCLADKLVQLRDMTRKPGHIPVIQHQQFFRCGFQFHNHLLNRLLAAASLAVNKKVKAPVLCRAGFNMCQVDPVTGENMQGRLQGARLVTKLNQK